MSFKFQEGDGFECESLSDSDVKRRGTIKSITYNSIFQDWEYVAEWDGFPGKEFCYECVSADKLWEKSDIKLSFSNAEEIAKNNKTCDHHWALYTGFTEEYQYCTKCGVKG